MKCRWCETDFPDTRRGDQIKVFCSTFCKNQWNSAARALARTMEEHGIVRLADWWNSRARDNEGETT